MFDLITAAQARAANLKQNTQRPSQRRCAPDEGARGVVRMPAALSLRADSDGDTLLFNGLASATERAYEMYDTFGPYTEIVDRAAFDDTLARADLDVPLVIAHDQIRRIARTTLDTLRLSVSDDGLAVGADLDQTDVDVRYIAPKIRSGLIDEMSFAFRIESGQWSPDYSEYRITKVDMHRGDVAIVGFGANPYTTATLRSVQTTADYRGRQLSIIDLAIASVR